MLIADILNVCGDQHSRGFYNIVVQKMPAELVRAALSETKYRGATGQIKKSKGAFFTDEIRRIAKARGIDLRLNLPGGDTGAASSCYLKWAGGKRWQVPHLRPFWAEHTHRRMVEPGAAGLRVCEFFEMTKNTALHCSTIVATLVRFSNKFTNSQCGRS
jgi:hypothetical protein